MKKLSTIELMNETQDERATQMSNPDFPVVAQLRQRYADTLYTPQDITRYADYIQNTILADIAKGYYTIDQANKLTLADLYRGNDGN